MREIDLGREISEICDFIRSEADKAGFSKVIVGLSGGIDSSVTAALCVKALGSDQVLGFLLPYRTSSSDSIEDAEKLGRFLGIKTRIIEISPMVDSYFDLYEPEADTLRRGNRQARERMCILYDLSAKHKALVAGTGNRSELMIGYSTQYGDNACAFEPIGHLYKTEVQIMAEILGIPRSIITKKPTADLWEGQSDEQEMGISYQLLDELLYRIFEQKKEIAELLEEGYSRHDIEKVIMMHQRSEFKRRLPPVPE